MSISTALAHARDNRLPVEVLIEGHWLRGQVAAVDGYGVVLDLEPRGKSDARIESISVVNVGAEPRVAPAIPTHLMTAVPA